MSLRDGDGGLERFLGGRWVGGAVFQQHFAADTMQLGGECAMANPVGCRQSFVEYCKGAVDIASTRFGLSERNLNESVDD